MTVATLGTHIPATAFLVSPSGVPDMLLLSLTCVAVLDSHAMQQRTPGPMFAVRRCLYCNVVQVAALTQVVTAGLCTVICVCPYFAYMLFSYREFCTGTGLR